MVGLNPKIRYYFFLKEQIYLVPAKTSDAHFEFPLLTEFQGRINLLKA